MLTAQERKQLPTKVELKINLACPYGNTYPMTFRQFLMRWMTVILKDTTPTQ